MKTILVAGGAGYIGSHTVIALLNAGYEVIIADDLSNASADCLTHIHAITRREPRFYQQDLLERAGLERIFSENQIDGVIQLAGLKAVGESVSQPLRYYHVNLLATIQLCEVMAQYRCKTLVFSSSATVYGLENPAPVTEDMPLCSVNPYGWTKVMQEQILRDLAAADSGWSVLLLRYFNPIGAHSSGLLGESPRGIPNNLLPYVAKVACGELPVLHVLGGDYDTPDGTGVRDYIHVMDLAEGHVRALAYVLAHRGVDAINLGSGHGVSVLEIVRAYENACGHTIPYQIGPRRAGDLATSFADTEKAKRLLGWQAKRTLEEMCADSWRFTCKQL